MKLAFAGLGVMGFPMAGHLAKAGHEVAVFNRSPEKAARWVETHGGRAGATAADAAAGAEILFLCVGNDSDVRAVVSEALPAMAAGGIVVDHTTTSAVVAREMAELAARGGRSFIDAPVSGGQAGAEAGQLSVMCGGDAAAFSRAEPVIGVFAKAVRLMGGPGSGQLTKMVNQICIAGVVQGLAEGLHFAKRAGLDPAEVLAAVSKGAAQSWQMDNRWPTMAEGRFDFGFAVDWMRKDLGLVLDEAGRNGASLEVAALVDRYYAEVQALGGARWDTSSLVARLGAAGVIIRAMRRPDDEAGVLALDIDNEADAVFAVAPSSEGFRLKAMPVSPPYAKRNPKGAALDKGVPWDTAWVAEADGRILGFAATQRPDWNARLTLWHFYVDRVARRRGIGRMLMDAVMAQAAEVGAKCVWLETSNVNLPAVEAYGRMGFELCGLDLTLYAGTPAEGEFALFMSRPVGEGGA